MAIPQDVLDKINLAEDALGQAQALDAAHATTLTALTGAQQSEAAAMAAALAGHQDANAKAQEALAALKAQLGV